MGQGIFVSDPTPILCLADHYAARCSSISIVAHAGMAPNCGSICSVEFILPILQDFSREPVPFAGGPHTGRSRTDGGNHRALSLCASSYVFRFCPICIRDCPFARILLRTYFWFYSGGHSCMPGGNGGKYLKEGAERLRGVYGQGEISSHPVSMVDVVRHHRYPIKWAGSTGNRIIA